MAQQEEAKIPAPEDEKSDQSKPIQFNQTEFSACSAVDIHNRLLFSWQTLFIDIRIEKEYEKGHIKKSINIPFSLDEEDVIEEIKHELTSMSQNSKIDIYCYSNKQMMKNKTNIEWYKYIQSVINKEFINQFDETSDFYKEGYQFGIFNILDIDYQSFANKYPKLLNLDMFKSSDTIKQYPSIIIENKLLLGDSDDAENRQTMIDYKITHILNITQLIDNEFENDKELNIKYLRFQISDSPDTNIADKFEQSIKFITDALNENNGNNNNIVLVHCFAGISRSSSAVISYIMKSRKIKFEDAVKFVRSQRRIIEPNAGFVKQLKKWGENGYEWGEKESQEYNKESHFITDIYGIGYDD